MDSNRGKIFNRLKWSMQLLDRLVSRVAAKDISPSIGFIKLTTLFSTTLAAILKIINTNYQPSSESFCILCGKVYPSHPVNYEHCTCGTKYPPAKKSNQETIDITIEELRILTIWAESHASFSTSPDPNIIYAIVNRLRSQLINQNTTLTMQEEFIKMRNQGQKYITNHPAGDLP